MFCFKVIIFNTYFIFLTKLAQRRTVLETVVDHKWSLRQHEEITDRQIHNQRVGGRPQRSEAHEHEDHQGIAQEAKGHYARVYAAERNVRTGRRRRKLQPERIDDSDKVGVHVAVVGGQGGWRSGM